jgi:heptosyltransferase-2
MSRTSILVYAPSWVGDAVMSLGAVRSLKAAYPRATLTVLTRPGVGELYAACEAVDRTWSYDAHGDDRGWSGLFRAGARLRGEHFDTCVVLPNAFRAAVLAFLAGIPERWGYATESRGFLLTKTVPPAPRPFGRHQTYFYLDLLAGLGIPILEADSSLECPEEMRERGRRRLREAGWDGRRKLIAVHPGATNSRAKIWPPERYAEVAGRLAAAQEAVVAVLGGPDESTIANEVLEKVDEPALMLQGRTGLGDLMGVLMEVEVLLTNDSGPMHLAAALSVPTVAIFGPTDPVETGPASPKARVVREKVDCSPCLYRDCPIDHRCMERVEPARVFEVARDLLAEQPMKVTRST